jgi:hypothetical protein
MPPEGLLALLPPPPALDMEDAPDLAAEPTPLLALPPLLLLPP